MGKYDEMLRRRAQRSTGPKTARGKRRSALNRVQRGLCPGWVAQELVARGENPEGFRRLHRDLIGWLGRGRLGRHGFFGLASLAEQAAERKSKCYERTRQLAENTDILFLEERRCRQLAENRKVRSNMPSSI